MNGIKRLIWCLFFFTALFPVLLHAQHSGRQNINSEDGLPSSECYSVMQDSKGYIWISTNKGAVRYNGRDMIVLNSGNGLTDNTVLGTFEDFSGKIWFRNYSGKLCYYYKNSVYSIAGNEKILGILNKRIISGLYSDKQNTLYATIYGSEDLVKIPSAGNYAHPELISRDTTEINCQVIDKNTYIFSGSAKRVFSKQSLFLNSGGKVREITLRDFRLAPFACVTYYQDSVLVLANFDNEAVFITDHVVEKKAFKNRILGFFNESDKYLWISVYKDGSYRYNLRNLSEKPVHFFKGYSVTSILKDFEGGMWFATIENGIFYRRSNENLFFEYRGHDNKASVRFLKQENDHLLLGTDFPALVAIDSNFQSRDIPLGEHAPGFYVNTITYRDPFYYLVSYGLLKRFDRNFNLVASIAGVEDTSFGGRKNATFKQIEFLNDQEFLMSDGYNIHLVKNYRVRKKVTLPLERINVFAYDSTRKILFVGSKSGLYKTESFSLLIPVKIPGADESSIIGIIPLLNGRCLIATQQHGVFIEKGGKLKKIFHEKNMLISGMCIDDYRRIWLAGNGGIVKLQELSGGGYDAIHISSSEGLQSNEVNHIAFYRGHVWYTTHSGLYYFGAGKLPEYSSPPKVMIEKVTVNSREVSPHISHELNYDENNISVRAHCFSYLPGGRPGLRYKLEGYDRSWNYSSSGHINYTNLPPGKYVLTLYGLSYKGVRSRENRTLVFSIRSPFWLTWWFILIALLLFAGGLYFFISMYVKRVRRNEEKKTEINRRLAEYRMTALRSQIDPHFIFNCISSIQALMLKNQTEKAYDYLQEFSKLLRTVLEKSTVNRITLKEELDMIGLYIHLEQLRFDGKFKYEVQIDPQLYPPGIYVPNMLLQPIIENAIWHGLLHSNKEEKIIHLSIKDLKDSIRIEIHDNGVGREESKRSGKKRSGKSFGQDITDERLQILNVREAPSSTFKIIDLYDENNKPSGTLVIIELPKFFTP
jgi:hypothetical protein